MVGGGKWCWGCIGGWAGCDVKSCAATWGEDRYQMGDGLEPVCSPFLSFSREADFHLVEQRKAGPRGSEQVNVC